MESITLFFQNIIYNFMQNLHFILSLIGIAWVIHIINQLLGLALCALGIYPRRLRGIPGIVLAPWLHGSWSHLIMNSLMFLALASFMILNGLPAFLITSCTIILLSGLGIWIFGRPNLHVGASALIMGYFGYLLMSAYAQPTVLNISLGVLCLYYLSNLFSNLFPQDPTVSWEGHLCGFISGIITSFLYPHLIQYIR